MEGWGEGHSLRGPRLSHSCFKFEKKVKSINVGVKICVFLVFSKGLYQMLV